MRDASIATGVPVHLVGGLVRDAALGRDSADLDLACGPNARRLIEHLERRWDRRSFRFRKRGVTTWRFVAGGREIDVVDLGRRGLDADLLRRDFTLNAVAYDPVAGVLEDPLGGLRDLGRGLLRLPRPGVVREDPVRALRAARFLGALPGFRLHPAARAEAKGAAAALGRARVERVRDELDALVCAVAPQAGVLALESLGLLPSVLPELVPLRTCVAGAGRPDVMEHTLDALAGAARPRGIPGASALADPEAARVLRWALLLHDVSKPDTLGKGHDGRPTFHGHEVAGARRTEGVLRRLRFPTRFSRRVARLVLLHLRPHHLADGGATPRALRRLVADAGEDLPLLVAHAACDARASGSPDARRRWRRLVPVLRALLAADEIRRTAAPPLLRGDDVMRVLDVGPGPPVGDTLREARALQEEGALRTRHEALAWLAERAALPGRG